MPSNFNPFSGLGKIQSYIRWNRFRGKAYSQIRKFALKKFGNRFLGVIEAKQSEEKLTEAAARRLNASGSNRLIEEIVIPNNKSDMIRLTGRVTNSRFVSFGPSLPATKERAFTFDLPRTGTKKQLRTTLREKILDAFFTHYEIANKYKPDFRKRFGDVEILDIEGV